MLSKQYFYNLLNNTIILSTDKKAVGNVGVKNGEIDRS